jgi:MraZ protein
VGEFEEQAQLYLSEPPTRAKGRMVRRAFFSRSQQAELDAQGRILIPPALRRFAGLQRDVVIIGSGEYLEIWSPEVLEAHLSQIDQSLEPTLESLEPRQ